MFIRFFFFIYFIVILFFFFPFLLFSTFRLKVPSDRMGYIVRPMRFNFRLNTLINCS